MRGFVALALGVAIGAAQVSAATDAPFQRDIATVLSLVRWSDGSSSVATTVESNSHASLLVTLAGKGAATVYIDPTLARATHDLISAPCCLEAAPIGVAPSAIESEADGTARITIPLGGLSVMPVRGDDGEARLVMGVLETHAARADLRYRTAIVIAAASGGSVASHLVPSDFRVSAGAALLDEDAQGIVGIVSGRRILTGALTPERASGVDGAVAAANELYVDVDDSTVNGAPSGAFMLQAMQQVTDAFISSVRAFRPSLQVTGGKAKYFGANRDVDCFLLPAVGDVVWAVDVDRRPGKILDRSGRRSRADMLTVAVTIEDCFGDAVWTLREAQEATFDEPSSPGDVSMIKAAYSTALEAVAERLRNDVKANWLAVSVQMGNLLTTGIPVGSHASAYFDLYRNPGEAVVRIRRFEFGMASRAGIQDNAIVRSINGKELTPLTDAQIGSLLQELNPPYVVVYADPPAWKTATFMPMGPSWYLAHRVWR